MAHLLLLGDHGISLHQKWAAQLKEAPKAFLPLPRRGCELLEGLYRLSEDVLEVIVRRADLNYRLKP
ncbi:hypothetical protein WJX84_011681 [Apatococcus fuscideae]|uniref:Uncharacterized protein n=1 Tax=Apatococcus fuscideae TaxID=2026836 RepID=A0AAW1SYJ3_9CHLO